MFPALPLSLLEMPLRSHFHGQAQLILAERLQQIALRPRFAGPRHRFEVRAARHIQNGHRTALLKLRGRRDPVELARQMHVQQHQIRPQLLKTLNRLLTGRADASDKIPQPSERRGHVTANEALVLDDEDADADAVGSSHEGLSERVF